jgi:hypothetical protein
LVGFDHVEEAYEQERKAEVQLTSNQDALRVDCVVNQISPDQQSEYVVLILDFCDLLESCEAHGLVNDAVEVYQKYPKCSDDKHKELPPQQHVVGFLEALLFLVELDLN